MRKTTSEAIFRLRNGRVTRASGPAICWKPSRKFVKSCFTKQAKEQSTKLDSFIASTWAHTPAHVDSLDATAALMKWANWRRGFQFSQYRAQLWEFVVEIADAALWLGWLFPVANRNEVAQEEAR